MTECLESLCNQNFNGNFEICIYDDGSTDGTPIEISRFKSIFEEKCIGFKSERGEESGGVGYSKNRAAHLSSGRFLCFCDADDISKPERMKCFLEKTKTYSEHHQSLLFMGSRFSRDPIDSTIRFTKWGNLIKKEQLDVQIYTSNGPTLLAPTWFISRSLYLAVGGFNQKYKSGYPEDLDFFYRAIDRGAILDKIEIDLVTYRYHTRCASFAVAESSIWNLRMEHLEREVLSKWPNFTIWSVGKQGKKFYRSLSSVSKKKVIAFCDVDEKKIKHGKFEEYDQKSKKVTSTVPVQHVKSARPPVIVCVKLDLTQGDLEALIDEKKWVEGKDFHYFS